MKNERKVFVVGQSVYTSKGNFVITQTAQVEPDGFQRIVYKNKKTKKIRGGYNTNLMAMSISKIVEKKKPATSKKSSRKSSRKPTMKQQITTAKIKQEAFLKKIEERLRVTNGGKIKNIPSANSKEAYAKFEHLEACKDLKTEKLMAIQIKQAAITKLQKEISEIQKTL